MKRIFWTLRGVIWLLRFQALHTENGWPSENRYLIRQAWAEFWCLSDLRSPDQFQHLGVPLSHSSD